MREEGWRLAGVERGAVAGVGSSSSSSPPSSSSWLMSPVLSPEEGGGEELSEPLSSRDKAGGLAGFVVGGAAAVVVAPERAAFLADECPDLSATGESIAADSSVLLSVQRGGLLFLSSDKDQIRFRILPGGIALVSEIRRH